MQKSENVNCKVISCIDRNQKIVKCCFDFEKSKSESDIMATIRLATGLDDFMTENVLLK